MRSKSSDQGRLARGSLLGLALVAVPLAMACGADKAADRRAPTLPPAEATRHALDITAQAGTRTANLAATPPPEATPPASTRASGRDVLPLFFENALSASQDGPGAPQIPGLGQGDPSLKAYLLTQEDLPPGYTVENTLTARVPDGISNTGGGDMAFSLAAKGQADDQQGDVLMSMVMRFDDLQDLDKAFDGLTASQIQDQLETGGVPSGLVRDVHTLDTSGLGDHAAGVALTLDLGALVNAIAGSLGDALGAKGTPVALPTGVPASIEMRMYLFGRGSYVGGLMHMSYGVGGHVDELGLAKIIDGRVAANVN